MGRYRAFLLVAETGSIGAAAGRLGLSEREIRRELARLEDNLGVSLLALPDSRLTAAGAAFVPYAQDVVAAFEGLCSVVGRDGVVDTRGMWA